MITEGIILAIDYNSNECTIRLPIFETVGMTESAIFEAKISIQPGSFNNYKVGDSVWVGFIDKKLHQPIILGKIYVSPQDELLNEGGTLRISNLTVVGETAELPQNTKLTGNYTEFDSIFTIIRELKTAKDTIVNQQNSIIVLEDKVKNLTTQLAEQQEILQLLETKVESMGTVTKYAMTDSNGEQLYDKNNALIVTKDIDLETNK